MVANPNLEAILATNPDLIIAQNFQEKAYEGLSKIAPTIILDRTFDKKAAQAKKKLQESIGNKTVMFLRVTGKDLRYYGIKNYKILYEDLGLQPPKQFLTDETNTFQAISMEKLPEINPPLIRSLASRMGADSLQQTY